MQLACMPNFRVRAFRRDLQQVLVFAMRLFVHLNLSCIRLMASQRDDVTKLEVLGCEVYHGDVKTR